MTHWYQKCQSWQVWLSPSSFWQQIEIKYSFHCKRQLFRHSHTNVVLHDSLCAPLASWFFTFLYTGSFCCLCATRRKLRFIATTVIPRPGKCHFPLLKMVTLKSCNWKPDKEQLCCSYSKNISITSERKRHLSKILTTHLTSKYAMPSGQIPNFPYVNCIQLCVLHWIYKHEVWIPHELCLTTARNLQATETWQALYATVKMFVMEMSISWFQQSENVSFLIIMLFDSTLLHLPHKPNPISIKNLVIFSLKPKHYIPNCFSIRSANKLGN